jgi:hypothetical protein
MKIVAAVLGLAVVALAGCHRPSPRQPDASPVAKATDYLQRINDLPQGARDAVFLRAINDAGFACQNVKSSEPRDPVQGYPAWNAHCGDGRNWVVVLEKNGIVQVVTPGQLRGDKS